MNNDTTEVREVIHAVKRTHDNGKKLSPPIAWCGTPIYYGFAYVDAQHLALSLEANDHPSTTACSDCMDAIMSVFYTALHLHPHPCS